MTRTITVRATYIKTGQNGYDTVDGLENHEKPKSVVYVSKGDEDPSVTMTLSQLCILMKQPHLVSTLTNLANVTRQKNIPVPEYRDVIQLRSDMSNCGGGFLRMREPSPATGLSDLDTKGDINHKQTFFTFHDPTWPSSMKETDLFLSAGDHCLVRLQDNTVGMQHFDENSSSEFPEEAKLTIETYGNGNDKSSYKYRFRFKKTSEEGLSYYLGSTGSGEAGVFEETNRDFLNLATFFKINCQMKDTVSADMGKFETAAVNDRLQRTTSRS